MLIVKCKTHLNHHNLSILLFLTAEATLTPLNIVRHLCMYSVIFSLTEAADLNTSPSRKDYSVTYYGPSSIKEGDNLTISCQMSRFQAPQWTHNDRPLEVDTAEDGRRISTDLTSESLQTSRLERLLITGVRLKDGGYYRCNSFSRRAHKVHVIPMSSRHSVDSSTSGEATLYQQLENEHERIEIDCRLDIANPKSPVYWYATFIISHFAFSLACCDFLVSGVID